MVDDLMCWVCQREDDVATAPPLSLERADVTRCARGRRIVAMEERMRITYQAEEERLRPLIDAMLAVATTSGRRTT